MINSSLKLIEMAKRVSPDNCNYFVFQGFLQAQAGNYKEAEESYNAALQKDDSSLTANLGVIKVIFLELLSINIVFRC